MRSLKRAQILFILVTLCGSEKKPLERALKLVSLPDPEAQRSAGKHYTILVNLVLIDTNEYWGQSLWRASKQGGVLGGFGPPKVVVKKIKN